MCCVIGRWGESAGGVQSVCCVMDRSGVVSVLCYG